MYDEMNFPKSNNEIENNIKNKINQEFGNDLLKLTECSEIKSKLEKEKQAIENSLLLNSGDVPSKISSAIKHVQDTFDKINLLSKKHNDLNKSIELYEEKVQKIKSVACDYIEKIYTLEKASDYLEVVKEIEELSNCLEMAVNEKNEKREISNYLLIYDIYKSLENTKCSNLYTFANETIHYWYNILKERFIGDYEEVLKTIKWPFIGSAIISLPTNETLNRFQILTEHLLSIQFTSILAPEFELLSLPMIHLIKPLKKRFIYHFMGKKQTNRPDKPEWYFTQVLTWIRDHQEFIEKNVQPVYEKFQVKGRVEIEFMRGLVQIAVEKIHYELPHLHFDDSLFCHYVDEALGFDKELKNSFGYPPSEPGVIEVLTQAQNFVKWINMEKKLTLEKMDTLLSSTTAFNSLISGDVDENRVTECGNSFLTLLTTITERYEMLPQPGHRLQFLLLQLDLIDDLRVRLLQKLREENAEPLSSDFPFILNTVNYVREVLTDWGMNTFFLHLQYYKAKIDGKENPSGTVFDEYIELLGKMKNDLLLELVDNVFMDFKAKSMPYRKDKWHAMESVKDLLKLTITASACPMFQILITKLHQLQKVLATSLFTEAWKMLANKIDQYLYEEIISLCVFNEGGASQFTYDITENFFPLFGQYSNKPEAEFRLLKDSCVLLSMPQGLAKSLREAVTENDENDFDAKEVLADLGIFTLTKSEALSILSRRTDLN